MVTGVLTILLIIMNNNMINSKKYQKNNAYKIYIVGNTLPLTISGSVVAKRTQILNSSTGNLQQISVVNGQSVTNGEVLMTVTNQDAKQAVSDQNDVINKAIRAVNTSSDTLKNPQKSYKQANDDAKSVAKDSLTQAQQSYNEANADLTDAKNKLVELQNKVTSNVTAPFDGIVSVDNDTKDGIPALTVTSSEKELKASISEYDYTKIQTGDTITVSGIDGKTQQKTTISSISQLPTTQSKGTAYYSFSAKVNNDFLYGQSVKVQVEQHEVKVPKSAVYHHHIYKIIDGKVIPIKADVTISGTSYIVNTGVSVGEKIVYNPDSHLKKGKAVND
jgi:HlyD family secretion protein